MGSMRGVTPPNALSSAIQRRMLARALQRRKMSQASSAPSARADGVGHPVGHLGRAVRHEALVELVGGAVEGAERAPPSAPRRGSAMRCESPQVATTAKAAYSTRWRSLSLTRLVRRGSGLGWLES